MKEWAQIAGGTLLTLVLFLYGMRMLPFVSADPTELAQVEGRVLEKATDSLSGSTHPDALTYRVRIQVPAVTSPIESILGREDFDARVVGDPIDVVIHRGRALAVADLRWHGPYRSRFWLILGAFVLTGAETLRRLYLQIRPGSR